MIRRSHKIALIGHALGILSSNPRNNNNNNNIYERQNKKIVTLVL